MKSQANGEKAAWPPGNAPISVILITRNEAHNMDAVLANLRGWAQEVFVVDSHSTDDTVRIARRNGAQVVLRTFRGFGDQWNFALRELPLAAPWTMKLDPDERLTAALKESLERHTRERPCRVAGLSFDRRLHFLGQPLPVRQHIVRVWRTGRCHFTDVTVNEHPIIDGPVKRVAGELEHHDSPDLHHWLEKQNRYTTAEALAAYGDSGTEARLFGSAHERRQWIKRNYSRLPFRYALLFLYHYLALGAWRAGRNGRTWAWLRCAVYRLMEYKLRDLRRRGPSAPRPSR